MIRTDLGYRTHRAWLLTPALTLALAQGALAQEAPAAQTDPVGSRRSQEYVDRLLRAYDHVHAREYARAIQGFDLVHYSARVNKAPRWAGAAGAFYAAVIRLQRGKLERGLQNLEEAVRLGFADPVEFHESIPGALRSNERVKQAYAAMYCTSADLQELSWLKAERSATAHDTSMMVIGNMNRKDRDFTKIAQTATPSRATRSASVIMFREWLRRVKAVQRDIVRSSDMSRMMHLMSMTSIDNMGGKKKSIFQKNLEMQRSRRIAKQAYERRLRSVRQREFRMPAGATTARITPPALGALKVKAPARLPDPLPPATAKERAADPNHFNPQRVHVGAAVQYAQTITYANGATVKAVLTERITSVFAGRCASRVQTKDAFGQVKTEYYVTAFEPTFKRQVLRDFSRLGKVELVRYGAEDTTHPFKGKEVAVRKVTVEARLTFEGQPKPQPCTVVYVVHKDVPAAGLLEFTFSSPSMRLHRALTGAEPGQPAPTTKARPNPLAAAKVGDWSVWQQTVVVDEKVTGRSTEREVVTHVGSGRLASQTSAQGKVTGDFATALQPSLKQQLMFDLDLRGTAELIRYKAGAAKYTFKGEALDARKIEMTVRLTSQGHKALYELTLWRSSKLPGLGLLAVEYRTGNVLTKRVLQSYGRAGE